MPTKLTDEAPHRRPGFAWEPEQEALRDAYREACEAGGVASGLVLVLTKFGFEATCSFIGQAEYNREQLRSAAATLKKVGGFALLAQAVEIAATMKPPGPPSWRQRMNTKHKRRTRELRKRQASNHRA